MSVTLVLGGARSGKSTRAQQLAEQSARSRIFIATAEALDDEMAARIARHQSDRGDGWETREVPIDLPAAIEDSLALETVVLVDCLTLWLSNLMHQERDIDGALSALLNAMSRPGELILVSNEVGLGLVPETALGRAFRDWQGRLNQAVAGASDRVEFVAAGLPMTLK